MQSVSLNFLCQRVEMVSFSSKARAAFALHAGPTEAIEALWKNAHRKPDGLHFYLMLHGSMSARRIPQGTLSLGYTAYKHPFRRSYQPGGLILNVATPLELSLDMSLSRACGRHSCTTSQSSVFSSQLTCPADEFIESKIIEP